MPIIVLSAWSGEAQIIEALDAGADDYLTEPFGLGELLNRRVFNGEQDLHLTPIQYCLLTVLVKHAGNILTHRQILNEVWGPNSVESPHYLRIYMSQLRHKLEADPTRPQYLLTESGVGFWLKV